jgi:uncharacterized protein (DUF58 family)
VLLDHRLLSGEMLESAVEKAAALVERELDAGAEVSLALCGETLPFGSGEAHLHKALTMLALVLPAPRAPAPFAEPGAAVLEALP